MILENGGETYRAEDTMVRMLANKVDDVETFVTPTGIFMSVEQGEQYIQRSVESQSGILI